MSPRPTCVRSHRRSTVFRSGASVASLNLVPLPDTAGSIAILKASGITPESVIDMGALVVPVAVAASAVPGLVAVVGDTITAVIRVVGVLVAVVEAGEPMAEHGFPPLARGRTGQDTPVSQATATSVFMAPLLLRQHLSWVALRCLQAMLQSVITQSPVR